MNKTLIEIYKLEKENEDGKLIPFSELSLSKRTILYDLEKAVIKGYVIPKNEDELFRNKEVCLSHKGEYYVKSLLEE